MEVRLNSKIYIQAEEIVRMHPEVFKEGKKKARQILEFKRIPQDDYIFGSNVKAGWKVSTKENCKAKLLITQSWLEEYLRSAVSQKESTPEIQSEATVSDIRDAPPILDLTESEKFKDHQGKILEIEVRGKREEDECFFRVRDVARCFNDIRCQDHILEKTTGYSPQDHFLFFYRLSNRDNSRTKELFFTTKGILKYLLTTNIKNRFSYGNIYIIQTREFLQSDIFKIGRTRFSTNKRLKQYPSQSILIQEFNYKGDINVCETNILSYLRNHQHIIHRFDLGKEYFEGNIDSIRSAIEERMEHLNIHKMDIIDERQNYLKLLQHSVYKNVLRIITRNDNKML